MFAIKYKLNGKHANLFKKFLEICRPDNKLGKNKRDKNKKLVFDMQVVKNQLNAIVIFSVRVFQLKNGICSHLFS
jgi:hypothetical protein